MNSFFDISAEISLDDGQSWVPTVDPQRLKSNQGPPLPARPATGGR